MTLLDKSLKLALLGSTSLIFSGCVGLSLGGEEDETGKEEGDADADADADADGDADADSDADADADSDSDADADTDADADSDSDADGDADTGLGIYVAGVSFVTSGRDVVSGAWYNGIYLLGASDYGCFYTYPFAEVGDVSNPCPDCDYAFGVILDAGESDGGDYCVGANYDLDYYSYGYEGYELGIGWAESYQGYDNVIPVNFPAYSSDWFYFFNDSYYYEYSDYMVYYNFQGFYWQGGYMYYYY
jgi:hypothetical protein